MSVALFRLTLPHLALEPCHRRPGERESCTTFFLHRTTRHFPLRLFIHQFIFWLSDCFLCIIIFEQRFSFLIDQQQRLVSLLFVIIEYSICCYRFQVCCYHIVERHFLIDWKLGLFQSFGLIASLQFDIMMCSVSYFIIVESRLAIITVLLHLIDILLQIAKQYWFRFLDDNSFIGFDITGCNFVEVQID